MHQRMKRMFLTLLFAIVGVGIGLYLLAPHPPRTPKQVTDVTELETYLQALTEAGDPPGLSLAVVKEGELIYNGAFGLADGVNGTAVSQNTVYHWWSMTKMATAVAIPQLHEQGNLGYITLGVIIEAVTGECYESYVVEHVLRPLGMTQTDFVYTNILSTAEMSQNEAAGSHPMVHFFTPPLPFFVEMDVLVQERIGTRYWFNRFYIDATPSTSLIWSAADAAKLMSALQDGGSLLSTDSIGLMRLSESERPLGWSEFGGNGRSWVQHRGGGPGFASIMRLYPDESLGVVIIANGTNLDSENLAELIAGLKW